MPLYERGNRGIGKEPFDKKELKKFGKSVI